MCGCSAGAAIQAARQANGQAVIFLGQPATPGVPCEYEPEQLQTWRTLLICAKDKALYLDLGVPAHNVNKYLGIVISAINYNTNPCYFKSELDNIAAFIAVLVNTGKC